MVREIQKLNDGLPVEQIYYRYKDIDNLPVTSNQILDTNDAYFKIAHHHKLTPEDFGASLGYQIIGSVNFIDDWYFDLGFKFPSTEFKLEARPETREMRQARANFEKMKSGEQIVTSTYEIELIKQLSDTAIADLHTSENPDSKSPLDEFIARIGKPGQISDCYYTTMEIAKTEA